VADSIDFSEITFEPLVGYGNSLLIHMKFQAELYYVISLTPRLA
jgi:hypothetical protein